MITIVQSATAGFYNTLAAQATLAGVTAPNALILLAVQEDFGGTGPTLSVQDAQGSYNADQFLTYSGTVQVGAWRLQSANSGSHTATCTASSGTAANSRGAIILLEVSGLASSPFDAAASATASGNSTTPAVTSGAAPAVVNSLGFAFMSQANMNSGGGTYPPTGGPGSWTSLYHSASGNDFGDINDQNLASQATAFTVGWGTLSVTGKWAAGLAIYKPAMTYAIAESVWL